MESAKNVVLVADRMQPRLGMEKALDSLLSIMPSDRAHLVLISGAPPEVSLTRVTTLNKPNGWRGRFLALRELRNLAKHWRDEECVVIATGVWSFISLAVATIFNGTRIVLWEHTILPWRIRNEWRVAFAALLVRLFSFRLRYVVCVSRANLKAVAPLVWPMKRLCVIPNVIIPSSLKPERPHAAGLQTLSSKSSLLLGVGSLTRRKNWELVLRALEHLPRSYRFELAGVGARDRRLKRLISKLGLDGRVVLHGYVPDADSLMDFADVIVHPSFAETFGYSMIEAAIRHRPVVALDMPVMNETIPEIVCGECARPNPKDYADAIRRAASADGYDYSLADENRRVRFSEDAVSECWAKLIAGS